MYLEEIRQMEIMDEIENMLFDFVELYNEVKLNRDSPKAKDSFVKLAGDYYRLVNNNVDIYSVLDREFADDSQLYILVLSVLFRISKSEEMLVKVEEILLLDQLSVDASLRVLGQVASLRFCYGLPVPEYNYLRKLHRYFLQRLERELDFSWEYIPYEERNHNLIILETDTLLSDYHAPTRLVLDIYRILKYEMGYEVYLIVDIMGVDIDIIEDNWVFPLVPNYMPELDGEFVREYEGKEILGYQQVIRENDLISIHHSIDKIKAKKPEFVWHIGGQSVLSDLFAKVTTMVSMGCTDGYPVSEAPILVSYIRSDKKRIEFSKEYMEEHGQRYLDIDLSMQHNVSGKGCSAKDFGIPEDGFIIAVVGNRLDTEISDEFLSVMETILQREQQVYFVIIGKCSRSWSDGVFRGRVVNLGFREDLGNVLKATHLFLNPRRLGGSGGAALAIAAGVPILTLGECDVAFVGEHFICDSIEKYPDMVSKYCHDQAFYDRQSQYALEKHRSRGVSRKESCEKVVKFVKDYMEECKEV